MWKIRSSDVTTGTEDLIWLQQKSAKKRWAATKNLSYGVPQLGDRNKLGGGNADDFEGEALQMLLEDDVAFQ